MVQEDKNVGTVNAISADLEGEDFVKASVVHDPFAGKNPVQIKAHPKGMHLRWCGVAFRERYGWRGWKPVKYSDPLGRNLDLYINDAPEKMSGQVDDFVRRGDSILCWIEVGTYEARQLAREQKALNRSGKSANRNQTQYADGKARTFGAGLEQDESPAAKPRTGMVQPRDTRSGMSRPGRNMVQGTAAGGDSTE